MLDVDADRGNQCDRVFSDKQYESLRDKMRHWVCSVQWCVRAHTDGHMHRGIGRVCFLGYGQCYRAVLYADVHQFTDVLDVDTDSGSKCDRVFSDK